MELQFERSACPFLDTAVREVRNLELTQEIRLPEGMPDIGRVLCAWGQTVLRGKEWRSDSVSFSGGLMVWVLYAPEEGGQEQCMEGWIPFQMSWDLPRNSPEGTIRIRCLPRFVDARSVSPRKIMIRAGTAAMAEAFVPGEVETVDARQVPETVELLRSHWPVRMPVEAGEKDFALDEELKLPGSAAVPESLICCRMEPKLTESRVLGNKLVFRGCGNLHILYRGDDGQLHGWDFEMPFSQFAELSGEYGNDAQGDLILSPTSLEPELMEDGSIRFRGGIVGQYLITDRKLLELTEDAYSPGRELDVQREMLEVPAVLETRRENIYGEQTIPAEADSVADVSFLTDFPRVQRDGEQMEVTVPGQFQILYYGTDGVLHAGTGRWEGSGSVPAGEDARLLVTPGAGEAPRASVSGGQLTFSGSVPLDMSCVTRQRIPMVTGLKLGQTVPKDPSRPSVILRRAGEQRLWDIAKAGGTTVEAIRKANGLQEEPAPDRMLLIPVP